MAAGSEVHMPGKVGKIKSFLQNAAVGDASHDFSGTRAGGTLFNEIFKKYKDIGAPSLPMGVERPMSEFEILNSVLQFAPPDTKDSDLITHFRSKILRDGHEEIFQRWDEDKIPYKLTANKVAIRPKEGDYQWIPTSRQMFEFMKGSKSDMAFAIDATNVPFYDIMLQEKGAQTAAGKYIYMRESVNDAATKVNIAKTTDTVVGIETIEDTASFNIMYPALRSTNESEIEKLSEQELFYSNYSLALASNPQSPSPSVTLSFYDKQMIRQIQILKGRKEDAHPNSVPTLSNKIRELSRYLTPKGNMNKKMEYFTALQQKRSGDWLQVLGCLQPERFGLSADTRITLVTLDKICVAYALFSGIDVMMTYFYMDPDPAKPNEYWMIRIYKDYQAAPETKEQQLSKIIQFYPRPESIDTFITEGDKKGFTYYKNFYIHTWNTINTQLWNDVLSSIQKINEIIYIARFDPKKFVKNYIITLLDTATILAVFRSLAPRIDTTYHNEEIDLYTQAITSSSYNIIVSMFEKYKKNYTILKNAILSKKASALSTEHALQSYFTSIYNKNKLDTKAHTDRLDLIKELQIFGKLFSSRNGGKNGVGIFTFLSTHLLSDEATKIRGAVLTSANHVPNDVKSQYMEFVNTANLLLGEDVPIQQITVKNADILESVNSQFSPDETNQGVATNQIAEEASEKVEYHANLAFKAKEKIEVAANAVKNAASNLNQFLERDRSRSRQRGNNSFARSKKQTYFEQANIADKAIHEAAGAVGKLDSSIETLSNTVFTSAVVKAKNAINEAANFTNIAASSQTVRGRVTKKEEEVIQEKSDAILGAVSATESAVTAVSEVVHVAKLEAEKTQMESLILNPDKSFQITDYTAALTLLSLRIAYIQTPMGQQDLEDFIQKNKVPDLVGGSRRSKQSSRKSVQTVSQIFALHNPYTTFYFLLRELSYRLSISLEAEEKLHIEKIINLIIKLIRQKDSFIESYKHNFEFKGEPYTSNPSVLEYMLYTTLEQYILSNSYKTNLLSIPSQFWKELVSSYLQGYLNVNKLHYTKEKLFLPEENIQAIFREASTFTSKKDLVEGALSTMNSLVKHVGDLDMQLSLLKTVKSTRKTQKVSGRIQSVRLPSRRQTSLKPRSILSAKTILKSRSRKSSQRQPSRHSIKSSQRQPSRRSIKSSQRQPSRRSIKSSQRQSSRKSLKNIPKKKPEYRIQVNQNADPSQQVNQNADPGQKQTSPQRKQSQYSQSINSENPIEIY